MVTASTPNSLLLLGVGMPFLLALMGRLLTSSKNPSRGAIRGFAIGFVGPLSVLAYLLFRCIFQMLGKTDLVALLACFAAALLFGGFFGRIVGSAFSEHGAQVD